MNKADVLASLYLTSNKGPRPIKSVKKSKRRLRRYRGRLKQTGWYAWYKTGVKFANLVYNESMREGFMRRMLKYQGALTGRFKPDGEHVKEVEKTKETIRT